ncbi:NTP transferase domain-containing protein [Sphingomonas sp. RG327]|uniref:NTP transferase domain-containing protein n=1 Tax=Sphingomonas anseongensis TaxID=2908207 RepID=A0ABT0RCH9_9SPHN|nr:NTP transferase domain-containing protein [Sphingomonas anseongensis]MCL6677966.1 NTP transferase domain-containing protein [Sphingomonas anseongensis]
MALGALIAAYSEDDSGSLRALLPIAGRTLLEYQVRCAAAAGAAPIVVIVERIPIALNEVLQKLQQDGLPVVTVSDGVEAASRFQAGELILMVADGLAPPPELLAAIAEEEEPTIVTVPDDSGHEKFERIDAVSRWAGVALVDSATVGATASMLGDWDLQSTLLRRSLQGGARLVPIAAGVGDPLLAETSGDLADLERHLIVASRGSRRDWASRYVLPLVEELATEKLIETRVRPDNLLQAAVLLSVGATVAFATGWLWTGLLLLVLTTPLPLIARRLAALRLKPMPSRSLTRRLLWPAAGAALIALGWWQAGHGSGWGALFAAATAAALAEAARVESGKLEIPGGIWLLSRRNAILAALPFAAFGAWTAYLLALAVYAGVSFFLVQHINHRLAPG